MSCCISIYQYCGFVANCATSVLISVPNDYPDAEIDISVKNGNGNGFKQTLDVINNFVEVDLTAIPDGFFNPYAGVFTLQFWELNGQVIPFTGPDGILYDAASFEVQSIAADVALINLFNYEYSGY